MTSVLNSSITLQDHNKRSKSGFIRLDTHIHTQTGLHHCTISLWEVEKIDFALLLFWISQRPHKPCFMLWFQCNFHLDIKKCFSCFVRVHCWCVNSRRKTGFLEQQQTKVSQRSLLSYSSLQRHLISISISAMTLPLSTIYLQPQSASLSLSTHAYTPTHTDFWILRFQVVNLEIVMPF